MFLFLPFLCFSGVYQITEEIHKTLSVSTSSPLNISIENNELKAIIIISDYASLNHIIANLTWKDDDVFISEPLKNSVFSFDGDFLTLSTTQDFSLTLISVRKDRCPNYFSVYHPSYDTNVQLFFHQNVEKYCLIPIKITYSDISAAVSPAGNKTLVRARDQSGETIIKEGTKFTPNSDYYLYLSDIENNQQATITISGNKNSNPFTDICVHNSGAIYTKDGYNNTEVADTPIQCKSPSSNDIWRWTAIALLAVAFLVLMYFFIRWIIKRIKICRAQKQNSTHLISNSQDPISVSLNDPLVNEIQTLGEPQAPEEKAVVFFEKKKTV